MVSVAHALSTSEAGALQVERLCAGLDAAERMRVAQALELVVKQYGERRLGTGEPTLEHALGMAMIGVSLDLDADARLAALCFSLHECMDDASGYLEKHQGERVARLVGGLQRLQDHRGGIRSGRLTLPSLTARDQSAFPHSTRRKFMR